MTMKQTIRARRKGKHDPRYIKQARKDQHARMLRQAESVARLKERAGRKSAKKR